MRSPGSWSFRESAMGVHHIIPTVFDTGAQKQSADPREGVRDPVFNHIRTEPDRGNNNPNRRLRLANSILLQPAA